MLRICQNCYMEFKPNNGKQKCCSRKCNVALWRKNNPEKDKDTRRKHEAKRKGLNRYNSEARKQWYKKKRDDPEWVTKINRQSNERRIQIQEFLRSYKLLRGCADCGYNKHHAALEFDHVDGQKEINICNSKSISQAKKEIEKCEVVCSNCHAIRTFERLQK